MTQAFIDEFISDLGQITTAIDSNTLIANTRKAVQEGLQAFAITPAEKAKLYANFEIQFSVQTVTKLIDTVMAGSLTEKQIETEAAKIDLLKQQLASEVNNTAKVAAEIVLLGENTNLVRAQTATEEKRKLDVMAGINVKNEQALSTRTSAKFEEARRYILISSTLFNNQIQKAKVENETLNSIALDTGVTISADHLTRVASANDAITLTEVSYTSELTTEVAHVNPGT